MRSNKTSQKTIFLLLGRCHYDSIAHYFLILSLAMAFVLTCKKNISTTLTLRTSEAGILTLRKLPYGVRNRYTNGTEVNARHQKSVYRRHGMSKPGARSRYTEFVFYRVLTPECPSHRDIDKIAVEK